MTVLIGSRPEESIAGELRAAWLAELRPGVTVVHVVDENPPEDDPTFWDEWIASIRRNVPGDLDAIFSSEEYGDEIAGRMAIAHVNVDAARIAVPVSATRIRAQPLAEWRHIPPPVRAYFAVRVAIVGPESSGKTTLARILAEHYGTAWVAEWVRAYMEARDVGRGRGRPFALRDIEAIGRGQAATEDRAARDADPILFCDTDLITTEIWSEIYFATAPDWVREESRRRRYALYLLLEPDVPWHDDGTREFPHLRDDHYRRLRAELDARGLPYVPISGDYEARFAAAVAAVDELMARLRG